MNWSQIKHDVRLVIAARRRAQRDRAKGAESRRAGEFGVLPMEPRFLFAAPLGAISTVQPDPRNTSISSVLVVFTEPVTGVSVSDFRLERNGANTNLLDGAAGVNIASNVDGTGWLLTGLSALTSPEGVYNLTLVAAGSGIQNAGGEPLAVNDSEEFRVDKTAPIVTINNKTTSDTTPSLSGTVNESVSSVVVRVNGVNYDASAAGGSWTLADNTIDALPAGTFDVQVTATDLAGNVGFDETTNELVIQGSDTTAPLAAFTPVSPDPRTNAVNGVTLTFNEDVTGVTLSDFTLTRDGGADLLAGSGAALTPVDARTYNLTGLNVVTAADGDYVLTLVAAGSGIQDASGNALAANQTEEFAVDATDPTVTVNALTTSDTTPPLTGSVNDPDATVRVTVAGTQYTATNNGNGTWTLADNTITPALTNGTFDVQVTATDLAGNVGSDATTNELTVEAEDNTAPTVTITNVSPDPRNTAVSTFTFTFSEPIVAGTFDLADLTLRRDNGANLLTGAENLSTADNQTFTLTGVGGVTGFEGDYTLTLNAAGSGIRDASDNFLTVGASESFTVDTTEPTATVTPLVTNDSTPQLTGTINDPTATVRLTIDGTTYTAVNNGDGTWTLPNDTITPLASGIYDVTIRAEDLAGNEFVASATAALTINAGPGPTADIDNVTPDPRPSGVDTLTIRFSEPIVGFDLSDLELTRDGGTDLLTVAQPLTTSDGGRTWTLGNLGGLTAAEGTYALVLTGTGSGIEDLDGNELVGSVSETFVVDTVVGPTPDAFEPDDTSAQAAVITTDNVPQTRSIDTNGDIDWVQFTITEESNVSIRTAGNGGGGDTVIALFGPGNATTLIATDDDSGAGSFSLIEREGANALQPGTYFVRVESKGNASTIDEYTLSVDADPVGTVGGDAFTDADGTEARLKITGPGTAQFQLNGPGEPPTIVVTGADPARTSVTVTTRGGTDNRVTVAGIDITGGLRKLSGKGIDVTGDITSTQVVSSITLGNIGDADQSAISIGGADATDRVSITADNVRNVTLDTNAQIRSLRVDTWTDDDATPDSITASSIGNISSADDFAADLNLDGEGTTGLVLGSVKVKDRITRGNWTINGDAGAINADTIEPAFAADLSGDLKSVKVKNDADLDIEANSVGSVSVGGAVTGGTLSAVNGLGTLKAGSLADAFAANVGGAIKSLTVKSDSAADVSAQSINTARFGGAVTGGTFDVEQDLRTFQAASVDEGFSANVGGEANTIRTRGNFAGDFAAAAINGANIGGSLVGANLLAGASFGADNRLGGGDDVFAAGGFRTLSVRGDVTDSAVGGGLSPGAGGFTEGDELIVGSEAESFIQRLTVGGILNANSVLAAAGLPGTVSINGNRLVIPQNQNFIRGA